jgi:outer membrane cobalamin receptor
MRNWLIYCLLLLMSTSAMAQKGRLVGTIEDLTNQAGIPFASIYNQYNVGVFSDDYGKYDLELDPGTHQITISCIGYIQQSRTVEISAGEETRLDVSMEPETSNIDIVVVSAGKFEQELGEVTMSMEVLQPDLIENKNTTQIDDILQQTPGVLIIDSEPQIRSGSGYSFGAGSRVMVLVDDLPMLSGDAGRPSWGFLPVENIEQIEVIKGASSVMYGSSALSGVINLRTAYPKAEPKTKITAFHGIYSDPQTGAAKYWTGTPMMSGLNFFHSQRMGKVGLVVGGSFLGDDGHQGPIFNEDGEAASSDFNPFDVNRYGAETRGRINMNLRIQSDKVEGLSYGVNTNWLKGESLNTLIWGNDSTGLYSSFDGAATRTKQVVGSLDPYIEYLTPSGTRHSLRTRWQKLDNNNDNNQGNFSNVYYGEYQAQHMFDSTKVRDLTITGGLVGIHTKSEAELYAGGASEGNNEANNIAGYLQFDKKFLDKLNWSVGMRYEYFKINDKSESKPVFRTGLSWELAEASFLRASYGQGYRFPTIAEYFIQTAVGSLNIYPNPELVSETSYNAEIGFKQGIKIGEFLGYADVAVFYQEFTDFIEFTFGQWNPDPNLDNLLGLGFKSVNTGNSRVAGFEFSLMGQGKIGEVGIQTLMGYTFTEPISTTPDKIYATSVVDPENPFLIDLFNEVTFASTSSNPANDILKYRAQHLIRADIEFSYEEIAIGVSGRYNSHVQNIDGIFEELDRPEFPHIPLGILNWREKHNNGDFILDLRASYQVNETHKIALIMNNALNREYAIRPLAIEPSRTTVIQYTINL